jgi:hypothetical protein
MLLVVTLLSLTFKCFFRTREGKLKITGLARSLDTTHNVCCRIPRKPVFLSVIYYYQNPIELSRLGFGNSIHLSGKIFFQQFQHSM